MTKFVKLAALAATVSAREVLPAKPAGWRDVLDTPAIKSPLASRTLLNGLALAGDRVVAVGQRGHIVYSEDSGKNWRQADVPVSSDLVAVTFPNVTTGWAVGHDGVVLRSTDGGRSFAARSMPATQVRASRLSARKSAAPGRACSTQASKYGIRSF